MGYKMTNSTKNDDKRRRPSRVEDIEEAFFIIQETAELLLKCSSYLEDSSAALRDDDDYCETYYALDTDILKLYMDPLIKADYLEIFTDKKKRETARSLAFLMGDFLVAGSEPLIKGHEKQNCRFLLIPPHDIELLNMLSATHRKMRQQTEEYVTESMFDSLSTLFEKFEENNDHQFLIDALSRQVPKLVELFNPYSGPSAALKRFALLEDNTFQRIDTYKEKDQFTFPLLDSINNDDDRAESAQMILNWEKRLRRRKVPHKPDYALRDDAEVLATLEYVNSELRYENKKVALITGSRSLFSVCEQYTPWADDKKTFDELYLRHPQAFLSNPNFFTFFDPAQSTFKLLDWLNLFFPWVFEAPNKPLGQDQKSTLSNIRDSKRMDEDLYILFDALLSPSVRSKPIESLLADWHTQVASIAKTRYSEGLEKAKERGASALASRLSELREKSTWSLEMLNDLIFKESLDSISTLYTKTVWVGLWSKAERVQSKCVPALRFDDVWKEIEKYQDKVIQLQLISVRRRLSRSQLDELVGLNRKLELKDTSLYHAHVIHALAFAVKGHWQATLTLAKIAMAICDNMDSKERHFRLGREAAYLACIATRRAASGKAGLTAAQYYLNEAFHRENPGWPEDVRFQAESLAIQTRMFYFDYFLENMTPNKRQLLRFIEESYELLTSAGQENDLRVRIWVQRQICVNLLTIIILYRKLYSVVEVKNTVRIDNVISIFDNVLKEYEIHNHEPQDDPYAHLILNVGKAIWGGDKKHRETSKKAAIRRIENVEYYTPYDEKRFEFLKSCIQNG